MKPTFIRLTLVAVIISLQLTSVLAVSITSSNQLEEQARVGSTETLKRQANEIVEKIRLFLIPELSQLTVAGQLMSDGMLDAHHDQQLATFFRSQLRSNDWLKGMYLARNDGSLVQVTREKHAQLTGHRINAQSLVSQISVNEGQSQWSRFESHNEATGDIQLWQTFTNYGDPRLQGWYRQARLKEGMVWTGPNSIDESIQSSMLASIAVTAPDASDAGVLSVAIDTEELTRFIASTNLTDASSALLIDERGHIIAHATANTDQQQFTANDSGSDATHQIRHTAAVALYEHAQINSNIQIEDDRVFDYADSHDTKQAGLIRPVRLIDNSINWTLILTQPHWHAYEQSHNILTSGMRLATIIIAAPGLIALVVIIAITGPVYRLYSRATKDQLTQAFNRDEFEKRLRNALTNLHTRAPKRQLLFVTLDLDGFKTINDQYGHPAGDAVLKTVVKRLLTQLHEGEVLGRLGGDEFAFYCNIDSRQSPLETIDKIRQQVVSQPVIVDNRAHDFGMTMGVSMVKDNDTVESVMHRGDQALVTGKKVRKNRTYLEFDERFCLPRSKGRKRYEKKSSTAA